MVNQVKMHICTYNCSLNFKIVHRPMIDYPKKQKRKKEKRKTIKFLYLKEHKESVPTLIRFKLHDAKVLDYE